MTSRLGITIVIKLNDLNVFCSVASLPRITLYWEAQTFYASGVNAERANESTWPESGS